MTRINKLILAIASMAVLAMTILGGLDTVTTLGLNRPLPAVYEITELLMAVAVFLAISSVQEKRENIAVDIIYNHMGTGAKKGVQILSLGLGLAFFSLMAWQGCLLAFESVQTLEYTQGGSRIPVYPAKIAFALGAILMVVQHLKDLFQSISGTRGGGGPQ